MKDTIGSTPRKFGKRRKRYLLVAGAALVLAVLATGWIVHAARRNRVANVGAMVDMTPVAEGLGKGFDALGKGFGSIATELSTAGTFSQQFVAELSQARLSSAYLATSKSFKARMDEDRFAKFVKGHPDLTDETARIDFTLNKKSANGTVILSGNVTRANAKGQATVTGDFMKGSENVTFTYGNSNASTSNVASTSKVKLVLIDEDGGLKVDHLESGDDRAP